MALCGVVPHGDAGPLELVLLRPIVLLRVMVANGDVSCESFGSQDRSSEPAPSFKSVRLRTNGGLAGLSSRIGFVFVDAIDPGNASLVSRRRVPGRAVVGDDVL